MVVKKISISIDVEVDKALNILADGEMMSKSRLIESIILHDKNIKMIISSMRIDTASVVYAVPGHRKHINKEKDKKTNISVNIQ